MKAFNVILMSSVVLTGGAAQSAAPEISYFSGSSCEAKTLIATLPQTQTERSCHDYVLQNGLSNAVVGSIAGSLPGFCVTPLFMPPTESFEQACLDHGRSTTSEE